jgi:nitrite reductase/ring-hydroxylating ferredoxin subunit
MDRTKRLICASGDLAEGGRGVRFVLHVHGREEPAFVVRHRGVARAYLNRCGHVPVELDWNEGEFFALDGIYLICATHGALYDPASGQCAMGRCAGRGLKPVAVVEDSGWIYLEKLHD